MSLRFSSHWPLGCYHAEPHDKVDHLGFTWQTAFDERPSHRLAPAAEIGKVPESQLAHIVVCGGEIVLASPTSSLNSNSTHQSEIRSVPKGIGTYTRSTSISRIYQHTFLWLLTSNALSCCDPWAFRLVGCLLLLAVRNIGDFIPMLPPTQGMITSDGSAAPDTRVSPHVDGLGLLARIRRSLAILPNMSVVPTEEITCSCTP